MPCFASRALWRTARAPFFMDAFAVRAPALTSAFARETREEIVNRARRVFFLAEARSERTTSVSADTASFTASRIGFVSWSERGAGMASFSGPPLPRPRIHAAGNSDQPVGGEDQAPPQRGAGCCLDAGWTRGAPPAHANPARGIPLVSASAHAAGNSCPKVLVRAASCEAARPSDGGSGPPSRRHV